MRKWIVKHRRAAAAAKGSAIAMPALLPVAVQAERPRSTARSTASCGLIVVELHGARVELVGGVDGDALCTVLRVLSAVRM